MNPRLRPMTVDAEHVILVLDRVSADPATTYTTGTTKAAMEDFAAAAKSMGAAGGLVFAGSVDLPHDDPQPEGLTIHADEIAALRRLSDVTHGAAGAQYRPSDREVLKLLIERAEQQRTP